jgi:hypothetical protein
MSEPLASTDPTKKASFTAYPPAPTDVPKEKKQPAVNLEYVPAGPGAATWKAAATPLTNTDPTNWPPDVLERNYSALRGRLLNTPASVTPEERALFAQMEKILYPPKGADPAKPRTATMMLADAGVTVAGGIEKAHMTTNEVEKYVAEYTAYVGSRKNEPKYAALHADAVAGGPAIVAAYKAADHERSVQALRLRVGELVNEGKLNALKVPLPVGLQPSTAVGVVSIPTAQVVDAALGLVPVAGQLWTALEIAIGKTMGGIGVDIPTTDRVFSAVMLVAPHAKKLLAGGGKSAEVVVELARRTGKTPEQVITLANNAVALEKDAPLIADACARVRAGKPLTAAHNAALDRAEKVLGFSIQRKYTPTVTGTAEPAGQGSTDKYGNVTYSKLGSPKDVALVKNHEAVHSYLSPKTLNVLREIRADFRMNAYMKVSTLRYLEEAAAEMYARVKVEGLNPQSVITGVHFPLKEGYVKFFPGTVTLGNTQVYNLGLVPEVAIGTIVYGGAIYTAVYVSEKAADATSKAVEEYKSNAKKAGAK